LGNILPLSFGIVAAVVTIRYGLVIQCLSAILVAWLGIATFGFYDNKQIKHELVEQIGETGELIGLVFDRPPSNLDAHAEIGLLRFQSEKLCITTEDRLIEVFRSEIESIQRGFNIHQLIGLGGWIVLHLSDARNLKIESRELNTMLMSQFRTKALFREIIAWKNERAPA
jgi:hypothetical protein